MFKTESPSNFSIESETPYARIALGFVLFLGFFTGIFAQSVTSSEDRKVLIVGEAKEHEIYSFGKTVIVEKETKGVLSFGGDIEIRGRVEGDVAVIGGNVIQKEGAFIGGDVIVFGGTYRAESSTPLRNQGKETVMVAMFEQELRDFANNPAQILSPSISFTFVVQRIISILFWFVISLIVTTIAPGAISRAVARFQLFTLKIFAFGFLGFLITIFIVIAGAQFLPDYLGAIVGFMAFILLVLGYVFGRAALQMTIGKILQKKFLSERYQSETIALLIGVIFWTLLLSIPYVWTLAFLTLFSASIGLVLTAPSQNNWHRI